MSARSPEASGLLHTNSRNVKQREVRKGTFSCWECKRRKTRCEFKQGTDSVCVSCRRRGVSCVGQEFADPAESYTVAVEQRMAHVESLVGQLVQQRSNQATQRRDIVIDLASAADENSDDLRNMTVPNWSIARPLQRASRSLLTTAHKEFSGPRSLSCHLHALLPDPAKAALILTRGKFSHLPVHLRGHHSTRAAPSVTAGLRLAQVSKLPAPTVHPVYLAQKLIQLALCLQQLDEPVHDAAKRYVEVASHYVTSQDPLVDSIDGVETLMLESCYYVNKGDVRRAWLTVRRALTIAQLIGLALQPKKPDSLEENVWFRLVLADRSLSWQLGMPPAVLDNTFANEHEMKVDAWSAKLERLHAAILGRIISRNLHLRRCRHLKQGELHTYDDRKVTQDIDLELQTAKRNLPTSWWQCPTFYSGSTPSNGGSTPSNAMVITEQLIAQMHHDYLLISLHQPYLFRKGSPTPSFGTDMSRCSPVDDVYSQITILSASREFLRRFLLVRSFHRALSYRGVDDKAFVVAMMFLLVHVNGHCIGQPNLLEHQRPHDLGILSEIVRVMKETSSANKDASSASMAQALCRLVQIEAEAASGHSYSVWLEETATEQAAYEIKEENNELSLAVPYVGSIRVAPRNLSEMHSSVNSNWAPACTTDLMPSIFAATEYSDNHGFNMSSDASLQFQSALSSSDAVYHDSNIDYESFADSVTEVTSGDWGLNSDKI